MFQFFSCCLCNSWNRKRQIVFVQGLVEFGVCLSQEMIHFAIHLLCPSLHPIFDYFTIIWMVFSKKSFSYVRDWKSPTLGFIHMIMHLIDWMAGNRRFYDYMFNWKKWFWVLSGEICYILLCLKVDRCFYITCSYYRSLKTQLNWVDVDYYDRLQI